MRLALLSGSGAICFASFATHLLEDGYNIRHRNLLCRQAITTLIRRGKVALLSTRLALLDQVCDRSLIQAHWPNS